MDDYKVSIVIPTYNRSGFIKRAVESVLSQSWENVEVIIVDDNSPDDTERVVRSINDARVTYIKHDCNQGAPFARNTGLKESSGEFICFLDDDDYWRKDKVEKQLKTFLKSDLALGLVYSGFVYRYEDTEVEMAPPRRSGDVLSALLGSNFIGSTSVPMIRRSCLDVVGVFDLDFVSCQDWDLWVRIAQKYKVDFVAQPLVVRVAHGDQISGDCSKKIEGRERFVSKHMNLLLGSPKQLALQWQRLGTLKALSNDILSSRTYYRKSLLLKPFDWRTVAGTLLTFVPRSVRRKILWSQALVHYGDTTFYH